MTPQTRRPDGTGPSDARLERQALADLLARLGPDQPTLCDGWTTRDLAAHLVMRERRPDAAAGIVLGPLRGYAESVRLGLAGTDYATLVDKVRRPPTVPWGIDAVDRLANTLEYFVHHEDVRRAQPGWAPRQLEDRLARTLWQRVRGMARLSLRAFPATVTIVSPGFGEVHAGKGGAALRLTGTPGELAMFFFGRQSCAQVEVDGPTDLVDSLRRAKFGV